MKNYLFLVALLFVGVVSAQTTLIRNVNIVPMTHDTVLIGHSVLIQNGIISAIGPSLAIPEGAVVINANGMYLTPGLIDMHAHLDNDFSRADYYRYSLACGVTTMRSMRTREGDSDEREKIESGKLVGPHLFLTAPPISADSTWDKLKIHATVYQAKQQGYACIKYLGGLDSLRFNYLAATTQEAGLKLAGHAPPGGLSQAINTGMASVEHAPTLFALSKADTATQRKTILAMAAAQVAFCPNLHHYNLVYNMYTPYERQNLGGLKIVPDRLRKKWDTDLTGTWHYLDSLGFTTDKQRARMGAFGRLVPLMARNGVRLLASPDVGEYTVPGWAMVEELMQFTRYGLTNYEALQTATCNAAFVLGDPKCGTIAVGNTADLVLLPENPLKNLRTYQYARQVIVKGTVYSVRKLRKGKY